MSETIRKRNQNTKMVPVPSTSIIPERDVGKMPVLECKHLGIDFGGLTAVEDFNLIIGKTEIAGLIGPNGAGKTTVFNLLTKVYEPTRGSAMINGIDMHGMDTVAASRHGIARTFQNIRLFSNMTVEDNVRIGLHNQVSYGMFTGILRLPGYWKKEKQQHEKALELLSIFGMQDMGDMLAGSLPYGARLWHSHDVRSGILPLPLPGWKTPELFCQYLFFLTAVYRFSVLQDLPVPDTWPDLPYLSQELRSAPRSATA